MVTWGAVNIFLWASYISSWNLADTAFIIQQEGISSGLPRMFALIGSHIIVILSILVFFVSLIILIGLPAIIGIRVNAEIQCRRSERFSLIFSVSLGIVLFFIILGIYLWLIVNIRKRIFYMNYFSVDKYFEYWIEEDIYKLFLVICAMALIGACITNYLEYKGKLTGKKEDIISFAKTISSMVLIVFIVFSFFTFTGVYSKGYGTDCMYLNISEDSSENQKNYIYSSISSGGKNVADELSKKADGKEHGYTLSSYVYSEDKDYLNVMVFSVREMSENGTPGNDLLGYKSGVLMSIKKNSIDGRYASNPYCFNGKL